MSHRHATFLLVFIVIGVIAGMLTGWFFGEAMTSVAWIGKLFLNALKMMIIPLILAAVISGVAALGDIRKLGRIGGISLAYYGATTITAVLIGLVMVNIIQPGAGLDFEAPELAEKVAAKQDVGITDIVLSMVSPNLIASAAETQLLPLILFAILFSGALTTLGKTGRHVIEFFNGINEAMMKLVTWLMYTAPIGIFALIASRLGQAGGGEAFLDEISAVGLHIVTVLSGLGIHFSKI